MEFHFLPSELKYKIISYIPHTLTILLKPIIKDYELYINDNDNIITFYEYIKNDTEYLLTEYNIKLHKKDNDNKLRCYNCGYYLLKYDYYFKNDKCSINCYKCFNNNFFK